MKFFKPTFLKLKDFISLNVIVLLENHGFMASIFFLESFETHEKKSLQLNKQKLYKKSPDFELPPSSHILAGGIPSCRLFLLPHPHKGSSLGLFWIVSLRSSGSHEVLVDVSESHYLVFFISRREQIIFFSKQSFVPETLNEKFVK